MDSKNEHVARITDVRLREFFVSALNSRSVREDVVKHVCDSLLQTSLRGVDSHGVELFPHYVRALDSGRINPNPNYRFTPTGASTGKLDADHGFGHAAGAEGMTKAIEMARKTGVGAVAVYNSTHYGAAAYFSLLASEQDMIGMNFTHADALMLSYSGVRPFFGTNPICMTVPCEGEEPFCLDTATTLTSWNKLLKYIDRGEPISDGWAFDAEGEPISDPKKATCLAPIGAYKGFGLSMMVEIFCSLLTGMPFGRNISKMYADPIETKRYLGHFFLAIDPARFIELGSFKRRMRELMYAVRAEPAKNPGTSVMVPGDPEKAQYAERVQNGIPLSAKTYRSFIKLAEEIKYPLGF